MQEPLRGIRADNRPHMQQTVSQGIYKPMRDQRKRIGPLDTAGSVAVENAKVYKELRRGRIEPSLASRLSQILINQRVILEITGCPEAH